MKTTRLDNGSWLWYAVGAAVLSLSGIFYGLAMDNVIIVIISGAVSLLISITTAVVAIYLSKREARFEVGRISDPKTPYGRHNFMVTLLLEPIVDSESPQSVAKIIANFQLLDETQKYMLKMPPELNRKWQAYINAEKAACSKDVRRMVFWDFKEAVKKYVDHYAPEYRGNETSVFRLNKIVKHLAKFFALGAVALGLTANVAELSNIIYNGIEMFPKFSSGAATWYMVCSLFAVGMAVITVILIVVLHIARLAARFVKSHSKDDFEGFSYTEPEYSELGFKMREKKKKKHMKHKKHKHKKRG
jgi:hypothetical protein